MAASSSAGVTAAKSPGNAAYTIGGHILQMNFQNTVYIGIAAVLPPQLQAQPLGEIAGAHTGGLQTLQKLQCGVQLFRTQGMKPISCPSFK